MKKLIFALVFIFLSINVYSNEEDEYLNSLKRAYIKYSLNLESAKKSCEQNMIQFFEFGIKEKTNLAKNAPTLSERDSIIKSISELERKKIVGAHATCFYDFLMQVKQMFFIIDSSDLSKVFLNINNNQITDAGYKKIGQELIKKRQRYASTIEMFFLEFQVGDVNKMTTLFINDLFFGFMTKESYLNKLYNHISKFHKYPRIAQGRGWQGNVLIKLVISDKGEIKSLSLEQSSGYEILDDTAMHIIKTAGPLPVPPIHLLSNTNEFITKYSIKYSLNKS